MLAHDPWDPKFTVHNLIDAVEGVFLVYDSVEKDPKRPDVLLFASVGPALKDFGRSVVCCVAC